MQKIFAMRHQPREGHADFEGVVAFLRAELGDEGVEVYASLEKAAYMTAFRLTTSHECLRDNNIILGDNQLEGIGPYGTSHIESLVPFPLFELTPDMEAEYICEHVPPLYQSSSKDHINVGERCLDPVENIMQHLHDFSYDRRSSPRSLPDIVSRTTNNVLFVSHSGIVEFIQRDWGFPTRTRDLTYLSGSMIIPSEGICKEFGPVTRYEVTKQVTREAT